MKGGISHSIKESIIDGVKTQWYVVDCPKGRFRFFFFYHIIIFKISYTPPTFFCIFLKYYFRPFFAYIFYEFSNWTCLVFCIHFEIEHPFSALFCICAFFLHLSFFFAFLPFFLHEFWSRKGREVQYILTLFWQYSFIRNDPKKVVVRNQWFYSLGNKSSQKRNIQRI